MSHVSSILPKSESMREYEDESITMVVLFLLAIPFPSSLLQTLFLTHTQITAQSMHNSGDPLVVPLPECLPKFVLFSCL